jgi:hypothetical protein
MPYSAHWVPEPYDSPYFGSEGWIGGRPVMPPPRPRAAAPAPDGKAPDAPPLPRRPRGDARRR